MAEEIVRIQLATRGVFRKLAMRGRPLSDAPAEVDADPVSLLLLSRGCGHWIEQAWTGSFLGEMVQGITQPADLK
jgi:hypothetical protein